MDAVIDDIWKSLFDGPREFLYGLGVFRGRQGMQWNTSQGTFTGVFRCQSKYCVQPSRLHKNHPAIPL